jgi:uncharacterized protein (TIGR03663 family)
LRLKFGASPLPEQAHSDVAGVIPAPFARWIRWAVFLLVALIGLGIRLPQLGVRPMHTDEAVNAYIVGQLLAGESFTYDARDRHGPALAALALPLARMEGAKAFSDLTESDVRLTSVLAGTVTILLFGAAIEMFGLAPCLIAAVLFAGASLPVYYDRYFIHESLFGAATFGLILSGWHAWRKDSVGLASLAAACAAIMLACKETAVLHFLALAIAMLVFWFWNLHRKSIRRIRLRALLIAAAMFILLSVALYTWLGRDWKALAALLHAVPNFVARAGGEGHQKPIGYYAQLLTDNWSGRILCALACVGLFLILKKRNPSPYSLLAYYFLFLAAIYSLIPYKTPWLALNFWLPISLFAARAVESLWRIAKKYLPLRAAIPAFSILAALAVGLIVHETRQRVFVHAADETNPYAYAHTSEDLLGLPEEISELAQRKNIASPRIAVIASDPWPLPWYLRHFAQVGFWQPGQPVGEADFYVTSTEASEQYKDQLRNFRPEFFGARPGVLILLWSPAPK